MMDFDSISLEVECDEQQLATSKRHIEMMAHHAEEVQYHMEKMDEHREELNGCSIDYDITIGENDE